VLTKKYLLFKEKMSQDTKYQVFISSTYTDLIEARSAAINTVLESYNFPVGMELFGADNDEQWTIIKELIDSSDFYILILGHRYGSISKEDGISFTEKEFDYAINKGLKLICFVRDDNVATHPYERDLNSENVDKLKLFRDKVLTNRLCEFWDSVDDLKHKISHSLYKNMRKHGGTGWVRGNQVSGQLAEELAKLSEENRRLREENEKLKQTSEIRKPELNVDLNDVLANASKIVINFPIILDAIKFQLPKKRSINPAQFPVVKSPLSSIFGGRDPIEFYDEYNADIDAVTELKINTHNQSMQLLYQLDHGLFQLKAKIGNIGTFLATNISLEITIPQFFMVIDNDDKLGIEYYRDKFSENLIVIDTPEERSKNSMHYRFDDRLSISHQNLNTFNFGKNLKNRVDDNNIIHIHIDSLLHSKYEFFTNFYLFPLMRREGIIQIKYICGEYAHPEILEIPIIVK
jgi:hypothetical protein